MLKEIKGCIRIKGEVIKVIENNKGKFITSIKVGENDTRHFILKDRLEENSYCVLNGI